MNRNESDSTKRKRVQYIMESIKVGVLPSEKDIGLSRADYAKLLHAGSCLDCFVGIEYLNNLDNEVIDFIVLDKVELTQNGHNMLSLSYHEEYLFNN